MKKSIFITIEKIFALIFFVLSAIALFKCKYDLCIVTLLLSSGALSSAENMKLRHEIAELKQKQN